MGHIKNTYVKDHIKTYVMGHIKNTYVMEHKKICNGTY